eukprot:5538524-Prymnesium_polylepis.1
MTDTGVCGSGVCGGGGVGVGGGDGFGGGDAVNFNWSARLGRAAPHVPQLLGHATAATLQKPCSA